MEPIKVQIKNYRSIPLDAPITITLKEGIQFIVGVNNVGKSNLLRFFSEVRQCFYQPHTLTNDGESYQELKIPFDSMVNQNHQEHSIEFSIECKGIQEKLEINPRGDYKHSRNLYLTSSYATLDFRKKSERVDRVLDMVLVLTKIMYIGATRVSISDAEGKSYDGSVGKRFFREWNSWATGNEKIKMRKISDLVEELKELFGFKVFSISVNSDNSEMIITNDEGAFALNELGTGMSQFIVTLGNALFLNPSFIFIDEPEINLHPKMQEMFVRSLAAKAKYGLIATSHSIGLARSVADDILSLTKESGKPKLVPFGRHFHTTIGQSISEMGFSQYTELGANHILLVEGVTDIKCFREILRKWNLDQHFVVMSLGGGDFITDKADIADELKELSRFNAKSISVVFDSERTSRNAVLSDKLAGFKKTCELLNFDVFPTEVHSTENYITQKAIDTVLGKGYKQLGPFENFNTVQKKWSKDKNWLMFREMTKEDFNNTELKSFIENVLVASVEGSPSKRDSKPKPILRVKPAKRK